MQDHISERCKEITNSIMKDDISNIFRKPCLDPDYIRTIDNINSRRVDLESITENLSAKRYPSFESWANDMIVMFDNSIYFNRNRAPAYAGIAEYLKRKVLRRIERVREMNQRNYEARLMELLRETNELMAHPPAEFKAKPFHSASEKGLEEFTQERVRRMCRGLNELVDRGDVSKVLGVLKKAGEEDKIDEQTGVIDLAGVGKSTLLKLEALAE